MNYNCHICDCAFYFTIPLIEFFEKIHLISLISFLFDGNRDSLNNFTIRCNCRRRFRNYSRIRLHIQIFLRWWLNCWHFCHILLRLYRPQWTLYFWLFQVHSFYCYILGQRNFIPLYGILSFLITWNRPCCCNHLLGLIRFIFNCWFSCKTLQSTSISKE